MKATRVVLEIITNEETTEAPENWDWIGILDLGAGENVALVEAQPFEPDSALVEELKLETSD